MSTQKATEIFTPSEFPRHTYVERGSEKLERRLRDALETPGEVVAVSGPSKSGKTVLVERVVGEDDLITVTGAGIRSPEGLWDRILDWMGAPSETSTSGAVTGSVGVAAEVKGSAGLPGLAKSEAGGSGQTEISRTKGSSSKSVRRGMQQVVEELADSSFVVLIDDFHYMDRSIQTEVAKQIKEAARLGVKICTASVPHRADDVVRSNPELRGRVRTIDLDYWTERELRQIAEIGFPLVGVELNPPPIDRFAAEASGSPQLMQAICLQTCFELDARESTKQTRTIEIAEDQVREILFETSTRTDFSSLLRSMHTGPKSRGQERKVFNFSDGTSGDVYRCILLSIAADPPCLSFPYNHLFKRVQATCTGDTPQAASIYTTCAQMGKMADDMYPTQRVVEWDEADSLLEIIDPYLLFYVRWSGRLQALAPE